MNKRAILKDESGQALIFAALSIFMLIACVALAANIAKTTTLRMQLQGAADSAVLAAAHEEANAMSTIAWLNDGMALVYYHMMRHNVDVTVHATLATLKEHGPVPAPDTVVGIENPVGVYNDVYNKAAEFMPKAKTWMHHMSYMQRTIALISPVLMEKTLYEVAKANGSQYTALFPKSQFMPGSDHYETLDITKIENGWTLDSSNDISVTAISTGEESWDVTATLNEDMISITVEKIGEDTFRVTYSEGGEQRTVVFDRTFYIEAQSNTDVSRNPDGSTRYCNNGDCFSTRNVDDRPQVNYGDGWVDLPREETVTHNGVQIRVNNQPIHFGRHTHVRPDRIHVGPITVFFTDPIRLHANFGATGARVENNYTVANGLSTTNADCYWRRYQNDRTMHRMCETSSSSWQYEYKRDEAYLTNDNMERFAIQHAMGDNDSHYRSTQSMPAWAEWYNPLTGRSNGSRAYHQTRTCWHPNEYNCPSDDCPLGGVHDNAPQGWWHHEDTNAVVICPTCQGQDNNEDGVSDVRIYQRDTYYRQGDRGLDELDYQTIPMNEFARPMALTNAFFKRGLTVAVWAKPDEDFLISELYRIGNTGFGRASRNEARIFNQGMFALASARAGFYDHVSESYIFNFDDIDTRETWVDESFANLYEPRWMAKLVPMKTLIRDEDIDADFVDSGLNYLFRGMAATPWRKTYFADNTYNKGRLMRNMRNPWNNRRFDLSGQTLKEVIQH